MPIIVLAIAAAIFGLVALVESDGKSWPAWGVLCLAILEILNR